MLGKMKIALMTSTLAAVAALAAAPSALAEERTCRGTLGAITVDNLRVPSGATCTLNRTRVEGTVKVERGATLKASGIRVKGNVQAERAKFVGVTSSTVGGSIQIVQGGRSTANKNVVGGDVQYFENRGSIKITRNRIDGNLQCKANVRAPTGGSNIVQGNKEDQCAKL